VHCIRQLYDQPWATPLKCGRRSVQRRASMFILGLPFMCDVSYKDRFISTELQSSPLILAWIFRFNVLLQSYYWHCIYISKYLTPPYKIPEKNISILLDYIAILLTCWVPTRLHTSCRIHGGSRCVKVAYQSFKHSLIIHKLKFISSNHVNHNMSRAVALNLTKHS
jgi:hypothetical protein